MPISSSLMFSSAARVAEVESGGRLDQVLRGEAAGYLDRAAGGADDALGYAVRVPEGMAMASSPTIRSLAGPSRSALSFFTVLICATARS